MKNDVRGLVAGLTMLTALLATAPGWAASASCFAEGGCTTSDIPANSTWHFVHMRITGFSCNFREKMKLQKTSSR